MVEGNTEARWYSSLWFLCAVDLWKPECLWELAHGYGMNPMRPKST